jgi:hypothetical protein
MFTDRNQKASTLMKKWLMAAAVAVAGLTAADARAQAPAYAQGNGSCANGDCGGAGYGGHSSHTGWGFPISAHFSAKPYWSSSFFGNPYLSPTGNLTRLPTLPVFMAAPWYNYWPYDGHFQTVAPMAHGLYYPPPVYTGNPYLPGQYPAYVPGNPAPVFPVTPAKP